MSKTFARIRRALGLSQQIVVTRTGPRVDVEVDDAPAMSAEVVPTSEGQELVVTWLTHLTGSELLRACEELGPSQEFSGDVEVVVYDESLSVLDVREYLNQCELFDQKGLTVRFNANAAFIGAFSIVWAKAQHSNPQVRGEVEASFKNAPNMVHAMIKRSAVPSTLPGVKRLVREARQLTAGSTAV